MYMEVSIILLVRTKAIAVTAAKMSTTMATAANEKNVRRYNCFLKEKQDKHRLITPVYTRCAFETYFRLASEDVVAIFIFSDESSSLGDT